MIRYRTHDVPVAGGLLRVGSWQVGPDVDRVVLAVHGITSSHRIWDLVAARLAPGTLLLAPDLRGRGRSGSLPGPAGMAAHADDCGRVVEVLADGRCDLLVGHSMGGFVAVELAARSAAGALLLVDGGLPLPVPTGLDPAAAMAASLGPAVARLSMTFPTREAYQDFWRAHPAFAGTWSDAVAAYVDYDLDPVGPPWRSSCAAGLIAADHAEMFVGGPADRAWSAVRVPVRFLRAPRGLLDEPGGLYPVDAVRAWVGEHPRVTWTEVPDVNHYTVVLGAGAAAVAAAMQG